MGSAAFVAMSKPCFLCQIDDRDCFLVSDHFLARFDDYPVTPGHFIIFPRKHIPRITDVSNELGEHLFAFIQSAMHEMSLIDLTEQYQSSCKRLASDKRALRHFEKMLRYLKDCELASEYNIGINDGPKAGQSIHHLHVHVMPRYTQDGGAGVGGVRFIFPELANYTSKSR